MDSTLSDSLQPTLLENRTLPAVLRPTLPGQRGVEAVAALLAHPEARVLLRRHGAILFRGFGLSGLSDFEAVVAAHFGTGVSESVGGLSPRGTLRANRIYESTRFPAQFRLFQHHEYSHMEQVPRELFFYCDLPAEEGGETPIADGRQVLAAMPDAIRREFEARGVCYRRHYYGRYWFLLLRLLNRFVGLHRPWQEALNASNREEARQRCGELGLSLTWLWDGSASVACNRPALASHPDTGEQVWFNQAALQKVIPKLHGWPRFIGFHLMYPFAKLRPFHSSYGDGGRIPTRSMNRIVEATDKVTVSFPWEAGDLLWIDNFLVSHGRAPFKGKRRIMVALGPRVTVPG